MRFNYSMINTQAMSDENLELVDELFSDWDLEDCVEADLPDDFFNEMRNTQQQICKRNNMTSEELSLELRPLLRTAGHNDYIG
jgi:hypothetical protein